MSQNFESESESTSIITRVVNDGNDTEDDIEEPMPKKRRGENIAYDVFKTYEALDDCLRELKEALVENKTWGAKEVQKTEMGEKRYFKCTHCTKRAHILIHRTNLNVTLYIQVMEHNNQIDTTKIPIKTKEKILSLYFENNLKAKDIGRLLRNNIIDVYIEVKDSTINNLVSRHKRTRIENDPSKSIDALINWT